jgi:hypothetical protein
LLPRRNLSATPLSVSALAPTALPSDLAPFFSHGIEAADRADPGWLDTEFIQGHLDVVAAVGVDERVDHRSCSAGEVDLAGVSARACPA